MYRLLQAIPEEFRLFVKEVLENDEYSEEQKERVIRDNVHEYVWSEYQQWKQTNVLKNNLPFLPKNATDTEVSVILEIVHCSAISEEVRDKYLRSFLSSEDFAKYEEWKPTNVVKTPDSFLRLLDDNTRPLVERRLKVDDPDAVELLMTKLASPTALAVYNEWKDQIKTQWLSAPTSFGSKNHVESALQSLDINGNRQIVSCQSLIADLQQKKALTSDSVASHLEQNVALPNAFPLSPIQTVNPVVAHIEATNLVVDNLAMLMDQVNRLRIGDEPVRLSAEITTTPAVTLPHADNFHDHRRQIREDSYNNIMANDILSKAAAGQGNSK